jgi:hypothetical protein
MYEIRVHSSLLFCRFILHSFAICRVTPKIKMHNSNPSKDRSIKIVRHLKQVFKPYHMMVKELGGGAAPITMFLQRKRKPLKILKYCFFVGGGGARQLF